MKTVNSCGYHNWRNESRASFMSGKRWTQGYKKRIRRIEIRWCRRQCKIRALSCGIWLERVQRVPQRNRYTGVEQETFRKKMSSSSSNLKTSCSRGLGNSKSGNVVVTCTSASFADTHNHWAEPKEIFQRCLSHFAKQPLLHRIRSPVFPNTVHLKYTEVLQKWEW